MYKLTYKNGVINVPKEAMEASGRADVKTLRVLLAIAAEPGADSARIANILDMNVSTVEKAVAFWQGAGILESDQDSETEAKISGPIDTGVPKPTIVLSRTALPAYTAEEMAAILSHRDDISQVIKECQNVYQKVLSRHEINVILALMDYLELDGEYVLSLAAFCAMTGDKNLRKLQALAVQFTEEGISTPQQLHETLRRIELADSLEGEIRKLFGIGGRSFTKKEQEMIIRWSEEYGFGKDEIKKAFEQGVNSTGSASLFYTDAILKRWYEEGIRTPEAIDAEISNQQKPASPQSAPTQGRRKKPATQQLEGESSFNPDDFLDAALMRSGVNSTEKKDGNA